MAENAPTYYTWSNKKKPTDGRVPYKRYKNSRVLHVSILSPLNERRYSGFVVIPQVIDSKPLIETPFEKLVMLIKVCTSSFPVFLQKATSEKPINQSIFIANIMAFWHFASRVSLSCSLRWFGVFKVFFHASLAGSIKWEWSGNDHSNQSITQVFQTTTQGSSVSITLRSLPVLA